MHTERIWALSASVYHFPQEDIISGKPGLTGLYPQLGETEDSVFLTESLFRLTRKCFFTKQLIQKTTCKITTYKYLAIQSQTLRSNWYVEPHNSSWKRKKRKKNGNEHNMNVNTSFCLFVFSLMKDDRTTFCQHGYTQPPLYDTTKNLLRKKVWKSWISAVMPPIR